MSDGEMERIDKALSEAFRSRMQEKSSKKGKILMARVKMFPTVCAFSDEAKSVVHFKLR